MATGQPKICHLFSGLASLSQETTFRKPTQLLPQIQIALNKKIEKSHAEEIDSLRKNFGAL